MRIVERGYFGNCDFMIPMEILHVIIGLIDLDNDKWIWHGAQTCQFLAMMSGTANSSKSKPQVRMNVDGYIKRQQYLKLHPNYLTTYTEYPRLSSAMRA